MENILVATQMPSLFRNYGSATA